MNKQEKARKMLMKKVVISYLEISLLLISIFAFSFIISTPTVEAQEVKYCCEKTTYGAWCQEAKESECDSAYRKTPTSCEATSYCKLGCCYDSSEGVCMENTPQKVCQENNGTWADDKQCEIPQCSLGCCVIGTQAAYVTLTRCKKLSAFYGLITDFRPQINSEIECISLASLSDTGACVYELDYGSRTCKFTSRQVCNSLKQGAKIGNESAGGILTGNVTFYKDYLCSNEELGTNCGPTKDTICVEGKDEVYFVDSCGNPANIYDASKVNDKAYWRKKISKQESCNSGSANTNSQGCGNCNYLSGSICKDYKEVKASRPTHGNNICADLNCKATTDGAKKHGEAWCSTDKNVDSVGSRYFRHLCINGEEIVEPCADYRQEECIQDNINGFSQAACRVNRWQECYSQKEKKDCENTDKRDCVWVGEGEKVGNLTVGCVPEHPPGLKFWEEGEAQGICALANTQCEVKFEEGLVGSEKCKENCECLEDSWLQQQLKKCERLGDCGAKVNWQGVKGYDEGYKIKTAKVEENETSGGLFGLSFILNKLRKE